MRGYVMVVTHLAFNDGLVAGDTTLMGCVSYGQWRHYRVRTTGAADAQLYVASSAIVGGLYAKAGRPPTLDDYDMHATPPLRELTLSPCDVSLPTEWHIAVMRGKDRSLPIPP